MVLKDGNVIDHGDYTTLMRTSTEFSTLINTHVEAPSGEAEEKPTKKKKEKQANGNNEARGKTYFLKQGLCF